MQNLYEQPMPDSVTVDAATLPPEEPDRPTVPSLSRLGDYEVLGEVARGGMGVVFRTRQTSLDRIVATKVLVTGQLASVEGVRCFRAKAEAAAGIQQPNIVQVFEVGEYEGHPFLTMEFYPGSYGRVGPWMSSYTRSLMLSVLIG